MKTKKYIDLHMHTRYSDGELTPKNLVSCMSARGMDIIAIADHDNYRAYFDAKTTAEKYGITLIPAAEITTPDYHLLALGFDPENKKFQKFLNHTRSIQKEDTAKIIKILQKYGVPISMEKLRTEFPLGGAGKGNIKTAMYADKKCRKYISKNHPEFSPKDIFSHFLGKNGIAKRTWEKEGVSPKKAINEVHKAGGIIGIGHAPKDTAKIKELEALIDLGLDFLEIQPNRRNIPTKGEVTYDIVELLAKEKGLPLTYGSDYHGPNFDRTLLDRGENVLSHKLENLLKNCKGINW